MAARDSWATASLLPAALAPAGREAGRQAALHRRRTWASGGWQRIALRVRAVAPCLLGLLAAVLALERRSASGPVLSWVGSPSNAGRFSQSSPPRTLLSVGVDSAQITPKSLVGGAWTPKQPASMGIEGKRTMPARYDAKLRALVFTDEYTKSLELLMELEEKGLLEKFLQNVRDFWAKIKYNELLKEEGAEAGAFVRRWKKAWPLIWPKSEEDDLLRSFNLFVSLFRRLETGRVLPQIVEECVPIVAFTGVGTSDQYQVEANRIYMYSLMERTEVMSYRLSESFLLEQYVDWMSKDDNVGKLPRALAPRLVPFVTDCLVTYEGFVANPDVVEADPVASVLGGIVFAIVVALYLNKFGGIEGPKIDLNAVMGQPSQPEVVGRSIDDVRRVSTIGENPLSSAGTLKDLANMSDEELNAMFPMPKNVQSYQDAEKAGRKTTKDAMMEQKSQQMDVLGYD